MQRRPQLSVRKAQVEKNGLCLTDSGCFHVTVHACTKWWCEQNHGGAGRPAEPLALTSLRGSRGAVSGGPGLYKAKWLLYRNMAVP